ncbi:nucleotidyltransferase domain-containing protein [Haladaptatus sp. GCM10025707]|uniref:nucleotidyltransferase domain-containing protein n=1 Tax=unclassified Haladaptatus TaxID=2622732 RepID=UPI0023E7927D|nr:MULTISPECIES: nucleotidyltransferase domain-containing protein [unclassified Haladaptatus]
MEQDIRVCLRVTPTADTRVFRLQAADDVLRVLVDAHDTEFTLRELGEETEHSRSTIWRAVELLDDVGLLRIRETPQRKYVAIDPAHLQKADPILGIQQVEYHDPIRAFVTRVNRRVDTSDEIAQLVGILVFGSVARGEADRKSDIDVFVLVDGDRTVARRLVSAVAANLGDERFNGDRYTFEPFVESVESVRRVGDRLSEIFSEGVTVYRSDRFPEIRKEVRRDEHESY